MGNIQTNSRMGNSRSKNTDPDIVAFESSKDPSMFKPLPSDEMVQGEKALFAMKTSKIEPDVLDFILEDDWIDKSDEELLTCGFRKTVDNAFLEDQHYMEGYFHALDENNPIPSLNPRDGQKMDKPPAPPRLRAFIGATQKKNAQLIQAMGGCFEEGSTMRRLIEGGNCLSDVVIQTRFGAGTIYDFVHWHFDTFNSIVHMALGLSGTRHLYTRHIEVEDDVVEKSEKIECCNTQNPGDVYLSSPTVFRHGVGHETLERSERIVAVQCRILMTREDYAEIYALYGKNAEDGNAEDLRAPMDRLANVLQRENFQLPTLDEIRNDMPTSIVNILSG